MEKHFELVKLQGSCNNYTAVLYNRLGGYFVEKRFLWYTKKEVIRILRHEYNTIVKRGF